MVEGWVNVSDEERAYAIRQSEDVREIVIARVVTDCLMKRRAFSFSIGTVLCFMVEGYLTFDEALAEFGEIQFDDRSGVEAYNLVAKQLENRDVTEDPELWFAELAKEVEQIAGRVLAGQGG